MVWDWLHQASGLQLWQVMGITAICTGGGILITWATLDFMQYKRKEIEWALRQKREESERFYRAARMMDPHVD